MRPARRVTSLTPMLRNTPAPLPSEPDQPLPVDTGMFNLPGSTAAFLLPGARPALVDSGSASTAGTLLAGLRDAKVESLDAIVLTHIHFDHAGGAGSLARAFPEATVYIHERVAKHLVDPTLLTEGVRSVWGSRTDELFGVPLPVAQERVRTLADGDRIDLGERTLRAIATPGHTRAHLSFLDESTGAMICGDALGVSLPGTATFRPATPPADFSLASAVDSIDRIRSTGAGSLYVGHYGRTDGSPEEACDRATEALHRWHEAFQRERLQSTDREDLLRRFHCALEAGAESASPGARRHLEQINPAWLNVAGMALEAERLERRA